MALKPGFSFHSFFLKQCSIFYFGHWHALTLFLMSRMFCYSLFIRPLRLLPLYKKHHLIYAFCARWSEPLSLRRPNNAKTYTAQSWKFSNVTKSKSVLMKVHFAQSLRKPENSVFNRAEGKLCAWTQKWCTYKSYIKHDQKLFPLSTSSPVFHAVFWVSG